MSDAKKKEVPAKSELEDKLEAIRVQSELMGIGFATVKDGKVMLISRDFLKRSLAHLERSGQEKFIVFIQDQDAALAKKGRS